jgi:hypothetical protein
MSHLEGNNIDDLFKRAAEKYPLRTDSADWSRMAAALEKDLSQNPTELDKEEGTRKRRFFWLLLLLPIVGIGYFTWQSSVSRVGAENRPGPAAKAETRSNTDTRSTSAQSVKAPSTVSGTSAEASHPALPRSADPATLNSSTPGSATSRAVTPGKNSGTNPGTNPGSNPGSNQFGQGAPNSSSASLSPRTNRQDGKAGRKIAAGTVAGIAAGNSAGAAGSNGTGAAGSNGTARAGSVEPNPTTNAAATTVPGLNGGQPVLSTASSTASSTTRQAPFEWIGIQMASTGTRSPVQATVATPHPAAMTPVNLSKTMKKPTHMYAGLMVSPDISTVKFQSVKGVGTTFSFLLGYNISSRFAIETGISLDRKKYYSDGTYFNSKTFPQNPNYQLLDVDGVCNMWELPVNLRYNISTGKTMNWFATAGFSSYFMTKEKYNYHLENNGYIWGGTWSSQKPSRFLFSAINLSIGYEQKLGNIGNLRLEPFVRLPLSGIGTGNLPIMSAGLNIGFTRRIW